MTLMTLIVALLVACIVFLVLGFFCSTQTLIIMRRDPEIVMWYLQQTLLPLTRREFWLPPCPICWAARGCAVMLVVAVVLA